MPLDGGVSSDIWRIEIGARRYCLKRPYWYMPRRGYARWDGKLDRIIDIVEEVQHHGLPLTITVPTLKRPLPLKVAELLVKVQPLT